MYYISPNLKYNIYDFCYQSAEYKELIGKKFQILTIEDTPEYIPFISRKEGIDIKKAAIYIRRGTADELVTEEELLSILNRRTKYIYPETGKPLCLEEHLKQLNVLYEYISPTIRKFKDGAEVPYVSALKSVAEFANRLNLTMGYETEKNPLYPDKSFEEYIAELIEKKMKKIERVLDLR